MTGCKIIKNRLTRFIIVLPLRERLLLALVVIGGYLGFRLSPGLLLGSFFAFGFGSPAAGLLPLFFQELLPVFLDFWEISRLPFTSVN